MPALTSRPYRYSPPPAILLPRPSADHKVKKMLPSCGHPSRTSLTVNTPRPYPRAVEEFRLCYEYTGRHSEYAGDSYCPTYDHTRRSYSPDRKYHHYGRQAYEEYYGEERGYGRRRDGGSWGRSRESKVDTGRHYGREYHGYRRDYDNYRRDYEGYDRYERDYEVSKCYKRDYGGYRQDSEDRRRERSGYYEQDRRATGFEIQPPVSQQGGYYREAQPIATGGQQYWGAASYYQQIPPSAPSWQGNQHSYQQGYQQFYDPAAYHGQQISQPYLQGYHGRQQMYVPYAGYFHQQPTPGYQQQQDLTQEWQAATNLNANAPTFQSQLPYRAPKSDVDNKDARTATTAPSNKKKRPVLKPPMLSKKYVDNARKMEKPLQQPRELLVVLDLNGTLLHRNQRGGSSFVARPKVNEFIQYLFGNHKVMVWSSAKPENVNAMCKKLFNQDDYANLVAVWARDTLRIPAHAYSQKVQVYKQLSWIWSDNNIQATNPDPAGVWDQTNTVLIDDSVEKATSEPYNLLCLEEFTDRPDQKESDVLGQVVKYLETLSLEKNVSAFMQLIPFEYKPEKVFDWDARV